MPLNESEFEYYSQQIKLSEIGLQGQEKLKNAKVLCIGAGGLSASLLLYLAGAGIGTMGIIDADTVEVSNLHRQVLYGYEQIGQSKVVMAKQALLALNPYIEINVYQENLSLRNAEALIQHYDIIADCTDNFATRYLINDVCFYLTKPYVFASVQQFQGQCSLFLGSLSPCLRCLFPIPLNTKAIPNCSEAGIVGVLPGLLGMLQATEIIKWLLQQGCSLQGKLLTVDLLTMRFKEFILQRNPECPLCVYREPLQSLNSRSNKISHGISAKALQKKLKKNKPLLLIDVRTPEESLINNPLGGRLIPIDKLLNHLDEFETDVDIIFYCHSGIRSQKAVELFKEVGFKRVNFLLNGLLGWRSSADVWKNQDSERNDDSE